MRQGGRQRGWDGGWEGGSEEGTRAKPGKQLLQQLVDNIIIIFNNTLLFLTLHSSSRSIYICYGCCFVEAEYG